MARKLTKSALLNIVLSIVLVIIVGFGYFYLKKLSPVEVITSNVTFSPSPQYTFDFAIYNGIKDFIDPYEVLAFNGSVYVSDTKGKVVIFDRTGQVVKEVVSKDLQAPAGMFWDGQKLYVADAEGAKVIAMDANGNILEQIELESNVLVADIVIDNGYMYYLNNRPMFVEKYDLETQKVVKKFGGIGKEEGKLYYPYDLTIRNGQVYVADSLNNRINIYDLDGEFIKTLPKKQEGASGGGLSVPRGLAFDREGRLLTVEGMGHRVTAMNEAGEIEFEITKSDQIEDEQRDIYLPTDLTFDELGRLYVLEHANKRVLVYRLQ